MNDVDQPTLQSNKGVVATIGIRTSGDRCAIVLPLATENDSLGKKTLCNAAADDISSALLAKVCPCLSANAYVSFIECVGMDDGFVPHRIDFGPTDNPGLVTGDEESSQVGALIVFYSEPDDLSVGGRMRVGKNTIPGIADSELVGNTIQSSLETNLESLAQTLAEGFTNSATGGGKWYRVCSAPPKGSDAVELVRTGSYAVRGYTGTQRRRLLPH